MTGAKQKLTIRQVNEKTGPHGPVFTAMLNPAKYSRVRRVEYTKGKVLDNGTLPEKKLKSIAAETLDLDELVFDGTGIVDIPAGSAAQDVDGQIDALKKVLYSPGDDPDVRLAVVEILWGSLSFQGRVESMSVSYTLFNADGTPLRARVKLSFTEYEHASKVVRAAGAAQQTRQIRLVGGNSLPLVCFGAYNDPSLHQAVALFNGLTTFRKLAPDTKLRLPKLK